MEVAASSLFSDIFGHEDQILQLTRMIERNTVPHALLFSGPSGVGKRKLARALAARLLQNSKLTNEENQKNVAKGRHPDLHLLSREEDKKDLGVEAVRELSSRLHLTPYYAGRTVAIIDNAEEMSAAAGNALLMTLEEPCAHSVLILITSSLHRILETIVSRCQIVHFSELSTANMQRAIKQLCPDLSSEDVLQLATIAEGSFAPLQIQNRIDPQTLTLTNPKESVEYLCALKQETLTLKKRLEGVFSTEATGFDEVLSLVSYMSDEKTSSPIFWPTLRHELRSRMRSASNERTAHFANLLQQALQVEQAIRERNLSSQLQLGSLMLDVADR